MHAPLMEPFVKAMQATPSVVHSLPVGLWGQGSGLMVMGRTWQVVQLRVPLVHPHAITPNVPQVAVQSEVQAPPATHCWGGGMRSGGGVRSGDGTASGGGTRPSGGMAPSGRMGVGRSGKASGGTGGSPSGRASGNGGGGTSARRSGSTGGGPSLGRSAERRSGAASGSTGGEVVSGKIGPKSRRGTPSGNSGLPSLPATSGVGTELSGRCNPTAASRLPCGGMTILDRPHPQPRVTSKRSTRAFRTIIIIPARKWVFRNVLVPPPGIA